MLASVARGHNSEPSRGGADQKALVANKAYNQNRLLLVDKDKYKQNLVANKTEHQNGFQLVDTLSQLPPPPGQRVLAEVVVGQILKHQELRIERLSNIKVLVLGSGNYQI